MSADYDQKLLEALRPARMYDYIPKRRGVAEQASKGICDPDYGLLTIHWLKPGQVWRVRLLPVFTDERSPFLRLVQHWWRRNQLVCPVGTDSALAQQHDIKKCPACKAGLEKSFSYILYVIQVDDLDRRHPLCLGMPFRYLHSIESLIKDGAFNFQDGKLLELHPDSNSLNPRFLRVMPEKQAALVAAREILHVRPRRIWPNRLKGFAAAYTGWKKAGEQEPEPGRHKLLQRLFPGCILVPMPWGCKGPITPDWQNVEYQYTLVPEYCDQLDDGNIGLLGGRDERAIEEGLVPDGVVVIVDADADDFAAELLEYNPWLDTTPCVIGGRGCKWIFRVEGEGQESCVHSTKIKCGDVEVGDWLATGKQGVVSGLHPSGRMYRLTTDRKLRTVPLLQFKLPKSYKLAGTERKVKWGASGWKRQQDEFVGPLLDETKLDHVVSGPDGRIEAGCPACRAEGFDSAGDNLLIYPSGKFSCARFIGCSPEERHEHNSQIYELARNENED